MTVARRSVVLLLAVACTDPFATPDGGTTGIDAGVPTPDDGLETGPGCAGPFDPGQLLTYRITFGGDWTSTEVDDYVAGTFQCEDAPVLQVGVRRRATGGGYLVDVNWAHPDQSFHGLKKLGFHTGVGEGSQQAGLISEYLAWRAHRASGSLVQRSALALIEVDGHAEGVVFNLERVDRRFLRTHLGDDSGWLFKISGSVDDGYRTNETIPNPYEDDFCLVDNNPCPPPPDLATWLPAHLAIDQLMRVGAVNILLGNSDGPIAKANNYYSYDYATGPRYYLPWDLDTTWTHDLEIFPTGAARSSFHEVLFAHWEGDYDRLFTDLLAGPLSVEAVHAEMDRFLQVGATAIDTAFGGAGSTAAAVDGMKAWYAARHQAVSAVLEAH